MRKTIYLLILTILALAMAASAITSATTSRLDISSIEITADDKNVISTSSSTGNFNVEPGQELRIKVKLENTYPASSNNDIEDVMVEAVMTGIDAGSDLSDEADTLSVRADGTRTVTLKIEIPDDASSYQSYDLEITTSGVDQNNTKHSDKATFDVDVSREENELVFDTLQVTDAECGRDARLTLEITNIGENEETDVELKVTSDSTGTLFSDTFDIASINDDSDDTDSTYRQTETLDTQDMNPGSYTLRVRVDYDDGRQTIERSLDFEVQGCNEDVKESTTQKKTEVTIEQGTNPDRDLSFLFGDREAVELQMPPSGVDVPRPPLVSEPHTSTFSLAVLVLANIAILIFIVLLGMTIFDR